LKSPFNGQFEKEGQDDYAAEIETTYKDLWCECLNEKAPW